MSKNNHKNFSNAVVTSEHCNARSKQHYTITEHITCTLCIFCWNAMQCFFLTEIQSALISFKDYLPLHICIHLCIDIVSRNGPECWDLRRGSIFLATSLWLRVQFWEMYKTRCKRSVSLTVASLADGFQKMYMVGEKITITKSSKQEHKVCELENCARKHKSQSVRKLGDWYAYWGS